MGDIFLVIFIEINVLAIFLAIFLIFIGVNLWAIIFNNIYCMGDICSDIY